jgi:hypothetical protein
MRVYLGKCTPEGDFSHGKDRHCCLVGGLYERISFVTDNKVRLKDGNLFLFAILEGGVVVHGAALIPSRLTFFLRGRGGV